MSYTRTEWKDGTTPIDAANMNKIEDGIAANADDISSLNDDLANCGGQRSVITNPGTGTYQILFNSGTGTSSGKDVGIIFFRGEIGMRHLSLFYNGYGPGSARCATAELTKGSYASYEFEEDNYAIDVTLSGTTNSRDVLGVFVIYGRTPTITLIG